MRAVSQKNKGFTIVELVVVIVVIGILAGIVAISYNSWRTTTAQNEVKSNLNGVFSAMESARTFSNSFPLSIPTTIASSQNVTLTYARGSASSFCITGRSTVDTSVVYYADSSFDQEVQQGTCPAIITNLIVNPSVETGFAAPTGGYYGPTIVVDGAKGAFGTKSIKATTVSTVNPEGLIWPLASGAPSTQYTCSISLTGTAGKVMYVSGRAYTAGGGYITEGLGTQTVTLSGSWQRISLTFTTPATTGLMYLQHRFAVAEAGSIVWADGAMCATGASTYNYADGNSAHWSWNGANASSSSTGLAL